MKRTYHIVFNDDSALNGVYVYVEQSSFNINILRRALLTLSTLTEFREDRERESSKDLERFTFYVQ